MATRVDERTDLSPRGRLLLAALGVSMAALLATARSLTPDSRGFGTHEQLGLAPCQFARLSGWRCPACGTTTAWAHALRGNVSAALAASVGGAALCGVTVFAALWTIASAMTGRWIGTRPTAGLLLGIGSGWLAVTVIDWVRRVATG